MLLAVLQTIGALLSGLSIFTAFIMYKKEKYDAHMRDIKESISDMHTVVNECNVLQHECIYSSINSFLSDDYIKIYVKELCKYTQNNVNITLGALKSYADGFSGELSCLCATIYGSEIYNRHKQNNKKLTQCIIYNLSELLALTLLLKRFQKDYNDAYSFLDKTVTNHSNFTKILCETIINNKVIINNSELIMQKVKMQYVKNISDQYQFTQNEFNTIYQLCNYILEKFSSLDNYCINKYIRTGIKKGSKYDHNNEIKEIIESIPDYILNANDKLKCGQIIGETS